jgi:hypothetical protein
MSFFTPKSFRLYGERSGVEHLRVRHTTNLFGGSGRGVLRLALVRGIGGSTTHFFGISRTPRKERFRRWPALATAWTAVATHERIVLSDWLGRSPRIGGQIVAEFRRPHVGRDANSFVPRAA